MSSDRVTGAEEISPAGPGEGLRAGSAAPLVDGPRGDARDPSVCPACANISMTGEDGPWVCRQCGYTGTPRGS